MVRKEFHPSMADRAVGRTLRLWRRELGLSLEEASRRSGFSNAKLSMMENALQPSESVDVVALGYVYGVPHSDWKPAAKRADLEAVKRQEVSRNQLEIEANTDIGDLSGEASTLRAFGSRAIPRLLQTHPYAAAMQAEGGPLHRPSVLAGWLARYNSNNPLTVEVVVTEQAVRRVVGCQEVTNVALMHLVLLADSERFTVQVLKDGWLADLQGWGSFCHLEFPHRQHDDVIYLDEGSHAGRYIEDRATCGLVRQSFEVLQHHALDPGASVDLIADVAS